MSQPLSASAILAEAAALTATTERFPFYGERLGERLERGLL